MKNKGATDVVKNIFLAVLIIAALGMFLMGPGRNIMNGVIEQIREYLDINVDQEFERGSLITAMLCSYERCRLGCDHEKIEDLVWEDSDGNILNCKEDFCRTEMTDKKGRVCGDKAREYPIKIILNSYINLRKDDVKTKIKDLNAFLIITKCTSDYRVKPHLHIDERVLKDGDKSSCNKCGGLTSKLCECSIDSNKDIFIWSDLYFGGVVQTVLCNSPP